MTQDPFNSGVVLAWLCVGVLAAVALLIACILYLREDRIDEKDLIAEQLTVYDIEEIHEDCTVALFASSATGEMLAYWWDNDREQQKERIKTNEAENH